ncbi:hypothetical protein L873DRAFT_587785 [Choiromyces venosus 120613-1]|uniref:Secreted protein n=1 Tax=Choiromyces venosus 120613-1 TaxID=1336337 RepID=A0A3N4IUI4_9PEZI|nr:hypothetical protein L873DRAFT_587785 [Choiromyces venosus 120613-1]
MCFCLFCVLLVCALVGEVVGVMCLATVFPRHVLCANDRQLGIHFLFAPTFFVHQPIHNNSIQYRGLDSTISYLSTMTKYLAIVNKTPAPPVRLKT